ncbi:MAG: hypothetical protein F6K30_19480 [Cyanothece sp. SIO2G6]|nr:hypothetical protein [Cyanothece sp. SIO2G6]
MKYFRKAAYTGLVCAFIATLFVFFNPAIPAAYADDSCPIEKVTPTISIMGEDFDTSQLERPALPVDCTRVIRSVIVSFQPEDVTGTISSISIVRGTPPEDAHKFENTDDWTDKVTEFGCSNIKVKNGDDLVISCGGTAVLKPGMTFYSAAGKDFKSSHFPIKFKVTLSEDFSDQYKSIYGLH